MIELNKVLLAGRLTRDPELKYLPSGAAVCELRIASGRTYYDKNAGEKKEETLFINVTAWGKSAEFCNQYFTKGKAIFIEGRLKLDQWERDGQKHERISVVAERVQFAEPKSADGGGSRSGGASDYGDDGDAESAPSRRGRASGAPPPPSSTDDDLPF
jgi:single-strand DNA-binding protein